MIDDWGSFFGGVGICVAIVVAWICCEVAELDREGNSGE